jgi:hypothetical protein
MDKNIKIPEIFKIRAYVFHFGFVLNFINMGGQVARIGGSRGTGRALGMET